MIIKLLKSSLLLVTVCILLCFMPCVNVAAADVLDVEVVAESTEEDEVTIANSGMQQFVDFMSLIIQLFKCEFTIYGFTFSYWQVFVMVCLAGVVGYFIHSLF